MKFPTHVSFTPSTWALILSLALAVLTWAAAMLVLPSPADMIVSLIMACVYGLASHEIAGWAITALRLNVEDDGND